MRLGIRVVEASSGFSGIVGILRGIIICILAIGFAWVFLAQSNTPYKPRVPSKRRSKKIGSPDRSPYDAEKEEMPGQSPLQGRLFSRIDSAQVQEKPVKKPLALTKVQREPEPEIKTEDVDDQGIVRNETDESLPADEVLNLDDSLSNSNNMSRNLTIETVGHDFELVEHSHAAPSPLNSISSIESPQNATSLPPADSMEKRVRVIEELIATEETYKSKLELLVEKFVKPLRVSTEQNPGMITPEQIRLIFSNVETLLVLHTTFVAELKAGKAGDTIGKVFEKFGAFLKMYTEYVKYYERANEELANLTKTSKKFRNFLLMNSRAGIEDVRSLLICPIQRIPRYVLLWQQLLRYTPQQHPERKSLDGSYKQLQEIANHVNDSKRVTDNMSRIMELQNHIISDFDKLLQPTRKLVREDILIRKTHGKVISQRKNIFFLFNDMLIWTTDNLKFKGKLDFEKDGVELEEPAELSRSMSIDAQSPPPPNKAKSPPVKEKKPIATLRATRPKESFLDIEFDTEAQRTSWSDAVKECLSKLSHRNDDLDTSIVGRHSRTESTNFDDLKQ